MVSALFHFVKFIYNKYYQLIDIEMYFSHNGNNMNPRVYEFIAEIKKVPDIDGAYIEFPFDIKIEYGKGRVKVHAEFNDVPYEGSIVNMGVKNEDGSVCYIIGVNKSIRQRINKQAGDNIRVKVFERA
ncbi:MAG: DUF1905 domain-containing protein [Treponema sp.]|nr:DUF1905 domain-containing protein [Treponema sp.]